MLAIKMEDSKMALQFVSDDKGNKIAVILPMEEYKRICEELEELE